jgi:hypothetical protein
MCVRKANSTKLPEIVEEPSLVKKRIMAPVFRVRLVALLNYSRKEKKLRLFSLAGWPTGGLNGKSGKATPKAPNPKPTG